MPRSLTTLAAFLLLTLGACGFQPVYGTRSPGNANSSVTSDLAAIKIAPIADRAGHKGTGRWTGEAALALGVPAPTLIAGYLARCLSGDGDARSEAQAASPASVNSYNSDRRQAAAADLAAALRATSVIAYAEGFRLIKAAAEEHHWDVDLPAVAAVWRGGCIVRARLLEEIAAAYRDAPDLALLSAAPGLTKILAETEAAILETSTRLERSRAFVREFASSADIAEEFDVSVTYRIYRRNGEATEVVEAGPDTRLHPGDGLEVVRMVDIPGAP